MAARMLRNESKKKAEKRLIEEIDTVIGKYSVNPVKATRKCCLLGGDRMFFFGTARPL